MPSCTNKANQVLSLATPQLSVNAQTVLTRWKVIETLLGGGDFVSGCMAHLCSEHKGEPRGTAVCSVMGRSVFEFNWHLPPLIKIKDN